MKPKILLIVLLLLLLRNVNMKAQNTFPSTGAVGIGTTTPNSSSLLEIKSTTKGILIPRMTLVQRNAIATPATGLLIFQTNNTPGFYYYSGTAWTAVTPKAKDWLLTGNAGTDSSINFLGTTDAHPLEFRVNNIKAGYLDNWLSNTSFGYKGLLANTTGQQNTASGYASLYSNINGSYNSAHGAGALNSNTDGNWNTANGAYSLYENIHGVNNTATGGNALYNNLTGVNNVANGYSALNNNTVGNYNTASGTYSLYATTGNNNTGNGYEALFENSTGNNNTASGFESLWSNTTGYSNVAIGTGAMFNSPNAHNFVAVGDSALFNQSAVGYFGEFYYPGYSTALGSKALYSNTSGQYNSATGFQSLYFNTTGNNNTANGTYALHANVYGGDLVAVGAYALYNNGTGASQSYEGTSNTALGSSGLYSNTTGYNNTASGFQALYSNTTGYNNAAYGTQALQTNTTGIGNTAVGVAADASVGVLNNSTAIGYYATVTASNQVRVGSIGGAFGSDPTSIGGKVGWSTLSDGRVKKNIKQNVPGLAFINKLQPITYNLDNEAINKIVQRPGIKDNNKANQPVANETTSQKTEEQIVHTGFVAQDVEKAAKSLNYDFSGVDAAKNDKDLYGLRYAEFVVPLVKAVQELSKMNDAKDSALQQQNIKIADLQNQINELKAMMVSNRSTLVPLNTGISGQQSTVISSASLQQNIPNPFTHNTTIAYTLPQKFNSAQIVITDKNGNAIKTINASGSSKGNVTVDASTLSSGAYQYSLIVDGRLIDTKQMILAK
jgi:hypothetical protein